MSVKTPILTMSSETWARAEGAAISAAVQAKSAKMFGTEFNAVSP
jgi:hypothetical protein